MYKRQACGFWIGRYKVGCAKHSEVEKYDCTFKDFENCGSDPSVVRKWGIWSLHQLYYHLWSDREASSCWDRKDSGHTFDSGLERWVLGWAGAEKVLAGTECFDGAEVLSERNW